MFLLQARQLLPQLAFFVLVIATAGLLRGRPDRRPESGGDYRVFHKAVQAMRKSPADQRLWLPIAAAQSRVYRRP